MQGFPWTPRGLSHHRDLLGPRRRPSVVARTDRGSSEVPEARVLTQIFHPSVCLCSLPSRGVQGHPLSPDAILPPGGSLQPPLQRKAHAPWRLSVSRRSSLLPASPHLLMPPSLLPFRVTVPKCLNNTPFLPLTHFGLFCVVERERQTETETENPKQIPHEGWSPTQGLIPQPPGSRPESEIKSQVLKLTGPPRRPTPHSFCLIFFLPPPWNPPPDRLRAPSLPRLLSTRSPLTSSVWTPLPAMASDTVTALPGHTPSAWLRAPSFWVFSPPGCWFSVPGLHYPSSPAPVPGLMLSASPHSLLAVSFKLNIPLS